MHRHLRGLLVAAAATLASASQPFSWADAQASMHACTNESRPLVDKYAYLSTRHPLGNALSGWTATRAGGISTGRGPCHRNLYQNAGADPGRLDTTPRVRRGNIATPNARGRGRER